MLSTLLVVGLAGTWVTMGTQAGPRSAARDAAPPAAPTQQAAASAGGAPVAPPLPATAPVATGDVVSPALELVPLALRIRDLPEALRGCARVIPAGDRWAAIAGEECADRRAAIAGELSRGEPLASLGGDGTERASALQPLLFRTTTRANVREGPSGAHAVRRSIPEDALVVGLVGEIEGARSEATGRGTWTRAVAARASDGWIATGLLRPWVGCAPSTASIGGAGVIAAAIRVHDGARETPGFVVFDPEGRSRVRVVRADARCALADGFDLPGTDAPVTDLFVTRVAEQGESLVVLGTRDPGARDGRMTWLAYRLGATSPSWMMEVRSDANLSDDVRDGIAGPFTEGPGGARGLWPVRTRIGRARTWWRWDGTTLVEDLVLPE